MAFTDQSDLFGSVHEDGLNLVVRHVARQRPSLFNYATPVFRDRPDLLCEPIQAADKVRDAGNPLFTEVEPLPVLGTPVPIGVNFCVQLTEAQVDFHAGDVIDLPPELAPLDEQRFALHARGCGGIDCPSREILDEIVPAIEGFLVREQRLAIGPVAKKKRSAATGSAEAGGASRRRAVATGSVSAATHRKISGRGGTVSVLPTREIVCFCLEIFAVGHFEWGEVTGSSQPWLKTRLDGLEIVDLSPSPVEEAVECYISTVVQLGVLPRLIVPVEKMVLDVTSEMERLGIDLGKQVDLEPAEVPAEVPNNPAVEEDQLKAFVDLEIT